MVWNNAAARPTNRRMFSRGPTSGRFMVRHMAPKSMRGRSTSAFSAMRSGVSDSGRNR